MKKILLLAFVFVASFSSTQALWCETSSEDLSRYEKINKLRHAANKLNQVIFDNWQIAEKVIIKKIGESNLSQNNKNYLHNLVTNKPWYIKSIEKIWEEIYLNIDRASYKNLEDCFTEIYWTVDNKNTKTRKYLVSRSAIFGGYDGYDWAIFGVISMDDTDYYDDKWNYYAGKQCTMWTFLDNAYKMCKGSFNEYSDFHYGLCDSTAYLQQSPGWSICWSNKSLPLTYFSFDLDQYAITAIWSVYTE